MLACKYIKPVAEKHKTKQQKWKQNKEASDHMRPPNGVTFSSASHEEEDTKYWNVNSSIHLGSNTSLGCPELCFNSAQPQPLTKTIQIAVSVYPFITWSWSCLLPLAFTVLWACGSTILDLMSMSSTVLGLIHQLYSVLWPHPILGSWILALLCSNSSPTGLI